MKKLNKILALLLALAMVWALAACGGTSAGEEPAPEEPPAAEENTPEGEEPTGDSAEEPSAEEEEAPQEETPEAESPAEEEPLAEEETPQEEPVSEADLSQVKLAVLLEYGESSLSQAAWESCVAFSETYGMECTDYVPNAGSDEARAMLLEQAVADGANLILMTGPAYAGTVVTSSGHYPEVRFVALDVAAEDLLEASLGADYDGDPANWDVTEYYNAGNVYCLPAGGEPGQTVTGLLEEILLQDQWEACAGQIAS